MGIRFHCSTCGHKLNVKVFQAGRRGLCPYCGASIHIPTESTRPSSKERRRRPAAPAAGPGRLAEASPQLAAPTPIGSPSGSLPEEGLGGSASPMAETPMAGRSQGGSVHAAPGTPSLADPGRPVSPQLSMPSPAGMMPGPAGMVPATPVPAPAQPAASPPSIQSPADPLAEAPGAVWYVRAADGGQYGPAAADVMRSWLAEGRVSPDSLVWREGWRDWQQAAGVFPHLGTGQLDPQLGAIAAGEAAPGRSGGGAYRRPSRSRSTTLSAAIITVLILAVIVLLVVFIWVLKGGPGSDTRSSSQAAPLPATAVEPQTAC